MQLASSIGSNDPCADADFDPQAIVDRAIATDDWEPVDRCVDRFVELATRGGPLEHVRFANDACEPDAGWLAWCEREIAYAVRRLPADRATLGITAHLLRRFGADSPIVDDLQTIQREEWLDRRERMRVVLHACEGEPMQAIATSAWSAARSARPMFDFAELAAITAHGDAAVDPLWLATVRRRVVDRALERWVDVTCGADERADWRAIAVTGWVAYELLPRIAREARAPEPPIAGDLPELVAHYEAAGDFAAAWLVRDTIAARSRRP